MKSFATLINMLPQDVIINHIAPYTYQTKPEKHLLDIRTFVGDLQMIEDYYLTMLNEHILLHDLIHYCKKKFGIVKIKSIYGNLHHSNPDKYTKIRFLWAKMTSADRCLFINDYILVDEEL